jgi:hypothetical protein
VPCEGPPGGPNPYPNPPPPGPVPSGLWPNQYAQWTPATVPEIPGVSLVAARDRGLPITANRVWVGTGYAWAGQIGGTSLPNIDGVISQMRMTGKEWDDAGRDPGTYATQELNFCQSRGWILHLSQNFYQGTTVRGAMTAAQVLANGLAWVDVAGSHPHGGAVYGMGGWKFEPEPPRGDVTTGDYLNAYAAWRNALATLGPPTFP